MNAETVNDLLDRAVERGQLSNVSAEKLEATSLGDKDPKFHKAVGKVIEAFEGDNKANLTRAVNALRKVAGAKPVDANRCLCGCGEYVDRMFVPGHDSVLKGRLLAFSKGDIGKGELGLEKHQIDALSERWDIPV